MVDTATRDERFAEHVNLNDQIDTEPAPANPTASLGRLFGNDIVAIDAKANGSAFFIVSRGGNYVLRATLQGGRLNIGAPNNVVRFQTGNIPTGIAVRGRFGYVNNEVGHSVSILDLNSNGDTLALNVPSSEPPKPGSHKHAVMLGKLVFFTALGVSDNGLVGQQIRDIVPLSLPRQAVQGRLEHLRLLPSGGALRRRHLDLPRRAAQQHSARCTLLQDQRPTRHPHQQLQRRARQRHGLQRQLARGARWLRFRK